MKVDIAKLDEKIKKLQHLRELAADPEMAELLAEFVTKNGAKSASNGHEQDVDANPLITYAEKACRALPNRFTTNDVRDKIVELGYRFRAKSPSIATYGVMLRLKKKGIISVVEAGSPGKLAKWTATR
jgi:hypothetical protein